MVGRQSNPAWADTHRPEIVLDGFIAQFLHLIGSGGGAEQGVVNQL